MPATRTRSPRRSLPLPATGAQISYLARLLTERPEWADDMDLVDDDGAIKLDGLTLPQCSRLIDSAISVPVERHRPVTTATHPANRVAPQQVEAGSYWTPDGQVARVRPARSTGRLYAEVWDPEATRFQYVRGLVYRLAARMTREEATAWGALHGRCCVCGRLLTDPTSVERGIGPVCLGRL